MKIKNEKRDYAFKEFLKGRTLKDISNDLDENGNKMFSFSWLYKKSENENWKELRKEFIAEKKNEIKEELIAADLDFQKTFVVRANRIIDVTLKNLENYGIKDEKAIVQFLKFLEEYKDKIKGVENTINIKTEVLTDERQIELLKDIAKKMDNESKKREENLNDYFEEDD